MGNGIGKLNLCFAGDAGEISRRRHHDIAVYLSDPMDEGLGHSFCYIRTEPSSKVRYSIDSATTTTTTTATAFRTISGASISANVSTPLSTALIDLCPYNNLSLDKAASFESSDSFASIPLQPIPRNSISTVRSGPIPSVRFGSGPIERGFLSGPIERGLISGPLESNQYDQLQRYKPKSKKFALMKILKRTLEKSIAPKEPNWVNGSDHHHHHAESVCSNNFSGQVSLSADEEIDEESVLLSQNVQWAQGKAGEDRVHVVISEEQGWDFVGIYDGFNGPDATDFLLNNLYSNVHKELKGILWNEKIEPESILSGRKDHDLNLSRTWRDFSKRKHDNGYGGVNHSDVLKALLEALRKTEEGYFQIADMMLVENPELALMGSCVLAMLRYGDDVYVMNVGDSRAILARKSDSYDFDINEIDSFPCLDTLQLTLDHSTSVEEEVQRIKNQHRDDASAVTNDRVKGSLKVTRAFGAGFLKQPKWNNALLEMFRIDYVGTSPYISCVPSLYHHRLGPKDKFLILSSDGLYQYFTNEEAVSEVETFIASFPEGDPAQHLVEEILFRAAKKAGMNFHELLEIPQGDRRRYHDDVSIIIISFEGRIWRSSM